MQPSKRFLKLVVDELDSAADSPTEPGSDGESRCGLRLTSIEVKDFFERKHRVIRAVAIKGVEERRHLGLPTLVYRIMLHGCTAFFEVVGLAIADHHAVRAQKEGVISPAGLVERGEHLRPNLGMARLVFFDFSRAYLEQKARAHRVPFYMPNYFKRSRKNPNTGG